MPYSGQWSAFVTGAKCNLCGAACLVVTECVIEGDRQDKPGPWSVKERVHGRGHCSGCLGQFSFEAWNTFGHSDFDLIVLNGGTGYEAWVPDPDRVKWSWASREPA